jgi:hypothetical protein
MDALAAEVAEGRRNLLAGFGLEDLIGIVPDEQDTPGAESARG